jgi:hypothetical protein
MSETIPNPALSVKTSTSEALQPEEIEELTPAVIVEILKGRITSKDAEFILGLVEEIAEHYEDETPVTVFNGFKLQADGLELPTDQFSSGLIKEIETAAKEIRQQESAELESQPA